MLESDLMAHLDEIEKSAQKVGFTTRRHNVRSLTVIQIQETNGEWVLFDPIRQGKDVSKLMFAAARKFGLVKTENEFRTNLIKDLANS